MHTIEHLETVWETKHQQMAWGQYPPEPLIRWIARTFPDFEQRQSLPVLDLGCGAGACLWYLAEQGFPVTGVDFSRTALQRAKTLLDKRQQQAQLLHASLTDLPMPDESYSLIVDLGGTASIPLEYLTDCFDHIYRLLKPGGQYFGCFLGDMTYVEGSNALTGDKKFFSKIEGGPLVNASSVRLFSLEDLHALMQKLSIVSSEEIRRSEANRTQWVQHYWISACKPL